MEIKNGVMKLVELVERKRGPLHRELGNIVNSMNLQNFFMDPDCGGSYSIPLYYEDSSGRVEYSNVDMLIYKDNEIKLIIEIEETGRNPIKIFGKFFASAFAQYYMVASERINMGNSITFIQILSSSFGKNREKSVTKRKIHQWNSVGDIIKRMIPIERCKIIKYELLIGNISEFRDEKNEKRQKLDGLIKDTLG